MQSHYHQDIVLQTGLEVAMAATPAPCPESTLTDRYQTTVPDPVRKALGLNKRDKICYTIQPNGKVWISRADQTESDPVLGEFLNFLARDMEKKPQHLQAISSDLVSHVQSLVSGVDLDLDAPLLDEDE
jgi:antitoxin PrlF